MTFLQHLWRNTELKNFVIGMALCTLGLALLALAYAIFYFRIDISGLVGLCVLVWIVFIFLRWLNIEHRKWRRNHYDPDQDSWNDR